MDIVDVLVMVANQRWNNHGAVEDYYFENCWHFLARVEVEPLVEEHVVEELEHDCLECQ